MSHQSAAINPHVPGELTERNCLAAGLRKRSQPVDDTFRISGKQRARRHLRRPAVLSVTTRPVARVEARAGSPWESVAVEGFRARCEGGVDGIDSLQSGRTRR
jgi:hypothetical protein